METNPLPPTIYWTAGQEVVYYKLKWCPDSQGNFLDSVDGRYGGMETYADRKKVLESLGYLTYAEYLVSDLWSKVRKRVFVRDNYLCQLCDQGGCVVHHLSYASEVLKGNDDRFLVTLCKGCHKRVEFARERKRSLAGAVSTYNRLLTMKERQMVGSEGQKCRMCGNLRNKRLTPCKYCISHPPVAGTLTTVTTVVTTTVTVVPSPQIITTKRYAPSGKGYHTYTCGTCGAILPRSRTIRYSAKVYRTPKVQPCTRCSKGSLGPDD